MSQTAQTSKAAATAVGIDLGTTFSCVSVWRNGGPEVLPDEHGNRTQPSYVAFTDEKRLIGEEALNQVALNPSNTIFDAKRLIGREFDDPSLQSDLEFWPFTVRGDEAGRPVVEAEYKGELHTFRPEEISAALLGRLRDIAEHNLGEKITKAVITVPAYFNDSQRQATKDAGTIAGLEVLRIINEPTAAAIAYGLDQMNSQQRPEDPVESRAAVAADSDVIEPPSTEKSVLVFDLGGGTFDVSLLVMDEGILEVKATSGDTHLGGEDFDDRMVHHLATEFETAYPDLEGLRSDNRAMRRLRTAAERAKRQLSTAMEASVQVDAMFSGVDFATVVSRAAFEEASSDLLERLMGPVNQVLEDAKMSPGDVDEIVLVGGSTRIPRVQEILSESFGGKELCHRVNPDEVVAMGAAIQAALLAPVDEETGEAVVEDERIRDLVLLDVTPLSLGLQTAGGIMSTLIPRNTTIPTRAEKTFSTAVDNQGEVLVAVFEGERANVADNHKLGAFEMGGIAPAPARTPRITVTFEIDVNGILTVWASNAHSGQKEQITIDADKGLLSQEQIEEMVDAAERFRDEDEEYRQRMLARNNLETYAYSMKSALYRNKQGLTADDKQVLLAGISEAIAWLEQHHEARLVEVQAKQVELEAILKPAMAA